MPAWPGQRLLELPAGGDTKFGEHLAEVPFHRAGAKEEFRGDLAVGAPVSGQADDVLLLRSELVIGVDLAFADFSPVTSSSLRARSAKASAPISVNKS
jgi:hypothetical protein